MATRKLTHTNLENLIQVVVNSVEAPNTQRVYQSQLETFFDWYGSNGPAMPFDRALVQQYATAMRRHRKSPSSINQALAAIRKLATESYNHGWISHEVATAISGIKNSKRRGQNTGTWLTEE